MGDIVKATNIKSIDDVECASAPLCCTAVYLKKR
jgi:hypothetical protein